MANIDHDLDPAGRQHLQGAGKSGLGGRVSIHTDEQGPVDALPLAVPTNGLRDGEDVRLVEDVVQRQAAMP
jgi:hypothetical protein